MAFALENANLLLTCFQARLHIPTEDGIQIKVFADLVKRRRDVSVTAIFAHLELAKGLSPSTSRQQVTVALLSYASKTILPRDQAGREGQEHQRYLSFRSRSQNNCLTDGGHVARR